MVLVEKTLLEKASLLAVRSSALCAHARINRRGVRTCSAGASQQNVGSHGLRKYIHPPEHKDARRKKVSANRDFLRSILESNATTREARSYLQAFAPPAVSQSPNFSQTKPTDRIVDDLSMRIALVKLKEPQALDDETLRGIGQTLFHLERLGLLSIVVLDCDVTQGQRSAETGKAWRQLYMEQTARLVSAINGHVKEGGRGARAVDSVVGITEGTGSQKPNAHIMPRKLLIAPLRKGIIPVVPSWGHPSLGQIAQPVDADEVILAITRELTGLHPRNDPDEDPELRAEQIKSIRGEASIDRLIVLDPKGGVPTSTRSNRYHVFINLEQEFEDIKRELLGSREQELMYDNYPQLEIRSRISRPGSRNPFSQFVEQNLNLSLTNDIICPSGENAVATNASHVKNLELIGRVLKLLRSNASALLTTPEEASNKQRPDPFRAPGVGTRPLRNPLIHNLLTDKPAFSSSLPASRIGINFSSAASPWPSNPAMSGTPTTFIKRGMPLTIFPNPRISSWQPPSPSNPSLDLQDSRIDLPRLVHLINDSFSRKLDVPRYLERIQNRIAGVIIAGEYEGGALLTWELPPGVPDDGSSESRARMVPYLDKFAVRKKSQGTGGVADTVFTAMVRDCFPQGVVWRSRIDNPVNKWYFERSRGTRKLAGSNWTMFWTAPNDVVFRQVGGGGLRIEDYEGVCRSIEATWADGKMVVD